MEIDHDDEVNAGSGVAPAVSSSLSLSSPVGVAVALAPAGSTTSTTDRNDLPPPRLMITQMVLENFKSYAGQQVIGPFHKNFSAVVGPNGSGKSNVIDALLFVFGKRAKQLRLNKVKELIHKSAGQTNLTYATVSVHFHEIIDTGPGNTDYTVVPNSECVISRVAKSDNTSTYKLNGKTTQFKEIAALLNSKGIDLDNNRFLILQGEVELISMMPPKAIKEGDDHGLLEYLEDIIGSNQYVEQTNAVMAQVEALTEQRQSHLQRVKAIQAELKGLEGAKQEAQSLLAKEREIRRKKNILFQLHLHQTNLQQQERSQQLQDLQQQLQQEREKLVQCNQRMQEIEAGLGQQQREYDTVCQELQQTKEEFASFERQDIQLKETIKHLQATKKKLASKISAETNKLETAQTKLQDAQESIPILEAKVTQLAQDQIQQEAILETILDERKGITQALRTKLESKQQELAPVQQQLAEYQNHLDTAQTEVDLLQSSTKTANERYTKAKTELGQLDQRQEETRTKLASKQDDLQQAKDRLEDAQAEDAEIAKKEGPLSARYQQCMALAEEAKASLQSKGGARSPAVKAILEAAKPSGELAKVGVLGRLGDLATIAEQYDVAVSTACGMLDYIVVQTTAGAQKCLEFLRRHNAGRANFIALDKLKKGAHDVLPQTPEGAPLLFSLIQPKHFSVVPALHLAVGHTLVAPDLATASRWAYEYGKRWRVVTLDGKLIETSGTMSGGGNSMRRGGMSLANKRATAPLQDLDEEEQGCERLEQEARKAEDLLQQCRNRRKDLAVEIRDLKKLIKSLEIELPKLTLELSGFDSTRTGLTKLIPELESQCKLSDADAAKLSKLTERVEECKADMSSCAAQVSKLEAEVVTLQKQILDAGGPRLKKQQDTCDKIRKQISDTEKALNTAKVTITASEKAIVKAQEAQAAAQQQLEECQKSMEDKKEERKTIEGQAFAVMQSFEKVKAFEEEKRAALDNVSTECDDLRKSQSDIKVVEIELVSKMESLEKLCDASRKEKQHWLASIEKLNRDMEEDEENDLSDDEEENEGEKDVEMQDSDDSEDKNSAEETKAQESKRNTDSALPTYSPAALEKFSMATVKDEISILETERNTIAKNANMGAIAEYRKKEVDYLARVAELDSVTNERNDVRKIYDDLRRKRLEMFMDGFGRITLKLKEMYQMITLGGDAELELVDSLDPFSEGIVFSVRPPKKSWKNISNLSGGEKTLSSLALVFALHHFKPTPLYVMDEIDAALDFKNVSIVAHYIKERTKNAQFVIISLRNNMFELADRLVGIYKTYNQTKSVTIDPKSFGVNCRENGIVSATPAHTGNAKQRRSHRKVDMPSSTMMSMLRRESLQQENNPNSINIDDDLSD